MKVVEDNLPGATPDVLLAPAGAPTIAKAPSLVARARLALRDREIHRVVSFLFAGGVSAMVTLTVTSLLHEAAQLPFLLAAVCGTELGILVNFSVNDLVSFRDLAGHRRSFPLRLARFHVTCALGQSVILLLSLLLHDTWHWRAIFAQAVPIVLVTALNFSMHRFWTYRGKRG